MPFKSFREFARLETSAGLVLFLTAALALVIDNSPMAHYYQTIFNLSYVKFSINDGLMAIFFLLVGLEIKREILQGELSSFKKCVLPVIAAFGGMLVPALIYIGLNWGDALALRGWAIPVATDIAFSLGILAILGSSRIPLALKIFLTALAIFDDIGAIVIIAVFYTSHISLVFLLLALLLFLFLCMLNYFNVRAVSAYLFFGVLLWLALLNSGVHATLAGVFLAFVLPYGKEKTSPLLRLEKYLHPWVAFVVLPLFAFANAGISFSYLSWQEIVSPISLGVIAGLFFGKQLGIFGSSLLGIYSGVAQQPQATNLKQMYGVSLVAGVGFTMSLFIGNLAFGDNSYYEAILRFSVLFASLLSGIFGYCSLRYFSSQT